VQRGGLRDPPSELYGTERVIEVSEGVGREPVAVVWERAFLELVPHHVGHPDLGEHHRRFSDRAPHELQRRRTLRGRVCVGQGAQLSGDPSGRGVDRDAEQVVDLGPSVGIERVPGVEDAPGAGEEVGGQVRLDARDDGRAGLVETRPGRGRFVAQASSPTRRRVSAGSSTRPVTKGPKSAYRADTSSKRIS
jgi:hypothetical protein